MPPKKEDKITLKQFKDKSSFWWLNNKVYHLNENNSVVFICGGERDEEEIKYLEEFCKRNKKSYCKREPSIFEQEEKEYNKIGFGKYFQMSTIELIAQDRKYASWIVKNSADKKLVEELKQLLKTK